MKNWKLLLIEVMSLALCSCQQKERPIAPISSLPILESQVSNFRLDTITTDLFVLFGMDWLAGGALYIAVDQGMIVRLRPV